MSENPTCHRKVNIPEEVFDKILMELENLSGWVLERGLTKYTKELKTFITKLESYQDSGEKTKEAAEG